MGKSQTSNLRIHARLPDQIHQTPLLERRKFVKTIALEIYNS